MEGVFGLTKHLFILLKSNKNKHNLMKLPRLDVFYLQQGRGREGRYYNSISNWKMYSLAKESRKLKNIFYLFLEYLFLVSSSKVDWIIAVKIIDRRMVRHAGIASLIGTLKSNLHINGGIQGSIKLHTRSANNKLTTFSLCFLDYF